MCLNKKKVYIQVYKYCLWSVLQTNWQLALSLVYSCSEDLTISSLYVQYLLYPRKLTHSVSKKIDANQAYNLHDN